MKMGLNRWFQMIEKGASYTRHYMQLHIRMPRLVQFSSLKLGFESRRLTTLLLYLYLYHPSCIIIRSTYTISWSKNNVLNCNMNCFIGWYRPINVNSVSVIRDTEMHRLVKQHIRVDIYIYGRCYTTAYNLTLSYIQLVKKRLQEWKRGRYLYIR